MYGHIIRGYHVQVRNDLLSDGNITEPLHFHDPADVPVLIRYYITDNPCRIFTGYLERDVKQVRIVAEYCLGAVIPRVRQESTAIKPVYFLEGQYVRCSRREGETQPGTRGPVLNEVIRI